MVQMVWDVKMVWDVITSADVNTMSGGTNSVPIAVPAICENNSLLDLQHA